MANDPVLALRNLSVEFDTPDGIVHAVDGVSYEIYPGETLGVVGESGSGKSVTVLAVLGLIQQPPGRIAGGEVLFEGRNIIGLPDKELRQIRNKRIAMVFQDPMTSMNPVFRVGWQIAEALLVHNSDMTDEAAKTRAIELLDLVGVPEPERRYGQYPHEFSGGMRQRAMIAMAIANQPSVLIADEPTTALDVTIQAQVLEVLKTAQRETQAATILITHDLGLIAEMADRVVVMYGGRVVEVGTVDEIFHAPRHPYTLGLMMSIPRLDRNLERLLPIPGQPPSVINLPTGCAFHPRCRMSKGRERCRDEVPAIVAVQAMQRSACHFPDEVPAELEREAAELGIEARGGRISER
jgi:oligopeptide/dipeptide ABC transporter ATP-binding protein